MTTIFPAIDLLNHQCIRLTKGAFGEVKVYHEDPVSMAQSFEDAGCTHLHLVDLEAAKSGQFAHLDVLEKIKSATQLIVDFGGGIRSDQQARSCLSAGADQINIGTFAIKSPDEFYILMDDVGTERIILSADRDGDQLKSHGWQENASQTFWEFIGSFAQAGGQYVCSTDISRDGMLSGIDLSGYQEIAERFPQLKVIVSGGVSSAKDVIQCADAGFYGVIVGKAIYENRIDLPNLIDQLKKMNHAH